MRILHVCPRFFPDVGGVENVVFNIASRTAERGHSNHIITTTRNKTLVGREEFDANITIDRYHAFAPGDAYWFSSKIGKRVRKLSAEYDIIHGHSYHAFPALQAFRNKQDCGFVMSTYYHGDSHSKIRNLLLGPYKLLTSKMISRSDAVVCISEAEKRLLESHFKTRNCRVIHVGTEVPEDHKLSPRGNNVVMIGRLEKYKNFQRGIEAICRIKDVGVDIIGSGPEEEGLRDFARSRGVSDRVTFHGFLDDQERDRLLKRALCLVSLSDYESFGIVLIEAAKFRVPVIASNIPSHREIAETLEGGVTLVNQNDKQEIYGAIKSILALDEPGMAKIERFSWDFLIGKYIDLYESIIHAEERAA